MKSLTQTYEINAPIEKVWDALVNPKTIEKWGGGPAKMKAAEGYEFSLWGGDIHGKNTKVNQNKELSQEWMSGTWDKFSKLSFKMVEKDGVTQVVLTQTNIPDSEYSDIAEGWKVYYMGEIKKLLEN